MELAPYVDRLRAGLAAAGDTGGAEARALVERLMAPLESAVRLTLFEVLSAAADEITRDLAPGSVEVRLRGLDPSFVVTPPDGPGGQSWDDGAGPASYEHQSPASQEISASSATARINLRLPDDLKARIEQAASQERLSINTWLVRAAASALASDGATSRPPTRRGSDEGHRYTGWVR